MFSQKTQKRLDSINSSSVMYIIYMYTEIYVCKSCESIYYWQHLYSVRLYGKAVTLPSAKTAILLSEFKYSL